MPPWVGQGWGRGRAEGWTALRKIRKNFNGCGSPVEGDMPTALLEPQVKTKSEEQRQGLAWPGGASQGAPNAQGHQLCMHKLHPMHSCKRSWQKPGLRPIYIYTHRYTYTHTYHGCLLETWAHVAGHAERGRGCSRITRAKPTVIPGAGSSPGPTLRSIATPPKPLSLLGVSSKVEREMKI